MNFWYPVDEITREYTQCSENLNKCLNPASTPRGGELGLGLGLGMGLSLGHPTKVGLGLGC
eukprot:1341438-Amorphochlora_amoeboformis.AAC.1